MAFSVQFTCPETVLSAYLNRNCAAWSIWQGKQFMFKYDGNTVEEGQAQLIEILGVLSESSNAIYTLKVYEDLDGKKIKENTPCDGSFNFKLNMESQMITNSQYTRFGNLNAMQSELAAVKEELRILREEREEPEEDATQDALGKIGALMENPVIMKLAAMIFGPKAGTVAPSQMPMLQGSIGNVPGTQDEEIKKAIEVLKSKDERIAEHLTKLAKIAVEQPGSFTFLLQSLDSL